MKAVLKALQVEIHSEEFEFTIDDKEYTLRVVYDLIGCELDEDDDTFRDEDGEPVEDEAIKAKMVELYNLYNKTNTRKTYYSDINLEG